MSLSRVNLQRELLRIFTRPEIVNTVENARRLWWEVYDVYARDAEDVSGDNVAIVNSSGFLKGLRFSFQNNYLQAAYELDDAFRAYWRGATFNVGSLILGTPSGCQNIGGNGVWASEAASVVSSVRRRGLADRLVPVFRRQSEGANVERAAADIAGALHAATTQDVNVTITGLDTTIPTPVSISNICTIF